MCNDGAVHICTNVFGLGLVCVCVCRRACFRIFLLYKSIHQKHVPSRVGGAVVVCVCVLECLMLLSFYCRKPDWGASPVNMGRRLVSFREREARASMLCWVFLVLKYTKCLLLLLWLTAMMLFVDSAQFNDDDWRYAIWMIRVGFDWCI